MSESGNTTTTAANTTTDSGTDSGSGTETSTMGDGDGDTSDQSSNASLSFYACAPDDDWISVSECDPFAQDCPEGEKCVPYASTGGELNANKCVPVTGDQPAGEPCSYGGPVEATDDCDELSHCFHVEDVDGMLAGTCTPFCLGTPDDPLCDPGTACMIANDGSINLCLATCHPVLQDCVEGQACEWYELTSGPFLCQLEPDPAALTGEPCGAEISCASGNLCAGVEVIPGCLGESCCTEYCDLDDPNFVCSNAQTECVPFFELDPPPGYETVGVCMSPPP